MKNPSIKRILVMILVSAAPLATANQGLVDATITDSMDSDELCVRNCVRSGAKYVMWDGRNAYVLSDQKAAEPWAGRKVRVLATLDAKTREIHVISIVAR